MCIYERTFLILKFGICGKVREDYREWMEKVKQQVVILIFWGYESNAFLSKKMSFWCILLSIKGQSCPHKIFEGGNKWWILRPQVDVLYGIYMNVGTLHATSQRKKAWGGNLACPLNLGLSMTDSGITLSFSCSIDFAYILVIGALDSSKWIFWGLCPGIWLS